jgi:hypothetical protein
MSFKQYSCFFLAFSLYASGKAFSVIEITPLANSLTSTGNTSITVLFDEEIDPATVNEETISIFGHWSGVANGSFDLMEGNKRLVFTPSTFFNAGEWVCVNLSKSIQSVGGDGLEKGYAWMFWVKSSPGNIELIESGRISVRQNGEGHIQTYGAHGGDLNHDGFSDFFVPNEISNDCRAFINDGNGNYDEFTIYPIPNGARPSTNESADFNRDGHLDLAVGNSTGDSITVFLGDGEGSFFSIQNYKADSGIRGLAVSDMDGDGDMDIVTANRSGNSVTILHNPGDGTFNAPIKIDANSSNETGCATGDANGDGILDLFVGAHGSGELSLMLGDGEGNFNFSDKVSAGGNGSWMVAVGDVNGDLHLDVVCVNSQAANVGVILGDGVGQLSPATTYPTGGFPIAVDLGDIDGDSDLDLITSNYAGGNWTYWENNGSGMFINRRILDADQAGSCATFHDRDNDGDLDMTGIDEESDLIFLFENTGPSAIDVDDPGIISVFPNPAREGWNISLANTNCVMIELLDTQGILRFTTSCIQQTSVIISSDKIAPGQYFMQMKDTDQRVIHSQILLLIE